MVFVLSLNLIIGGHGDGGGVFASLEGNGSQILVQGTDFTGNFAGKLVFSAEADALSNALL